MTPKTRNGPVEQMRVLLVARRSARQQRLQSLNQLRHLVFTSPEPIRVRFKDRYKTGLVTEAANMRLRKGSDPVAYTTNLVIRNLARRVKRLNNEMREIDPMLTALVEQTAPSLLALYGLGPDTAASLLVAVGEQPRPARFGGVLGPLVWCRPAPRQLMVDFEWGVASSIAAQAILGATPAITKGFSEVLKSLPWRVKRKSRDSESNLRRLELRWMKQAPEGSISTAMV